jgi:hypothetical protein
MFQRCYPPKQGDTLPPNPATTVSAVSALHDAHLPWGGGGMRPGGGSQRGTAEGARRQRAAVDRGPQVRRKNGSSGCASGRPSAGPACRETVSPRARRGQASPARSERVRRRRSMPLVRELREPCCASRPLRIHARPCASGPCASPALPSRVNGEGACCPTGCLPRPPRDRLEPSPPRAEPASRLRIYGQHTHERARASRLRRYGQVA